MKEFFYQIKEALSTGKDAVLCSIIASSGSTPRGNGAKMAVFSDGTVTGTVGGGAVEYQSICLAKEALKTREAFTKGFELWPNQTADIGMICGGKVVVYFQFFSRDDESARELFDYIGKMFEEDEDSWLITHISEGGVRQMGVYRQDIGIRFIKDAPMSIIEPMFKSRGILHKGEPSFYVEPLVQSGTVYVFGGGHVSQELVPVITHVGFRVVVYEDRENFASKELFPTAAGMITAPFTEISEHINIRENDYAVIMTRGHQADYEVLHQILLTKANYIGVIGSRHKIKFTFEHLMADGIPEEDLKRIHTPIGLPIKGETPAEIAISIAGELILHRAQKNEVIRHA